MDVNSIARFADRAADYVRYRPTYPSQAIDAILDGLEPRSLRAADVGAGTGISARLLAERGVRVVAIEPGVEMRQAAAADPRVRWIAARADATALGSSTVGLVLCAQSFHWFATEDALREFARVLTPRGRLALVWNRRNSTDPITAGYRQAIVDAGADMSVEQTAFDPGIVARSGAFSNPVRLTFPNTQRLDLEGLIGRARSASYAPASGPMAERLHERLWALFERHRDAAGFVTLVYETEAYRADALT